MPFRPLPPPEQVPLDERTAEFENRLADARHRDDDYLAEIEGLADDEANSVKAAAVERRLRDRLRVHLGMPVWTAPALVALYDWTRSQGINPSYELTVQADNSALSAETPVLQALMLGDSMDRLLSKMRDAARTSLEETGVNTLHIVFGFLE